MKLLFGVLLIKLKSQDLKSSYSAFIDGICIFHYRSVKIAGGT